MSLRLALAAVAMASGMAWGAPPESPAAPPPPPVPPDLIDAYVGFAPITGFPDDDGLWIRRGALQIDGERLTLHTAPLVCRKNEVFSSASDGGFFEYAGTLSGPPESRVATLTLVSCDYCAVRVDSTSPTYRMEFRVVDDGTVLLGGVRMDRRQAPFPSQCPSLADGAILPPELAEYAGKTP